MSRFTHLTCTFIVSRLRADDRNKILFMSVLWIHRLMICDFMHSQKNDSRFDGLTNFRLAILWSLKIPIRDLLNFRNFHLFVCFVNSQMFDLRNSWILKTSNRGFTDSRIFDLRYMDILIFDLRFHAFPEFRLLIYLVINFFVC